MKQERYRIFFDSPGGLLPGSLDLCQTTEGVTGHITMLNHGTNITGGSFEGERRDFCGTIWYKKNETPFRATGSMNDGLLELSMAIGENTYLLTGFPEE